ncbi:hypothetical protein O181_129353, partial [Austropuccinia psidii MF-1]|nr:hypothetical protein [Austropuccinia psidii MF-1]
SGGFTHYWCTQIPALELEYNTLVYSSTGQTPAMLEKGWNPGLPADTLRKDLIDIHPAPSSFNIMLDKVKHSEKQSVSLQACKPLPAIQTPITFFKNFVLFSFIICINFKYFNSLY